MQRTPFGTITESNGVRCIYNTMVKHCVFTKIISVTVGPNDPGGEKHFPVAEFKARALSL
jgi:hypothetical protein